MARFYSLSIEPTLFGGSSLIRTWGRIGTRGRHKIEFFETAAESVKEMRRLALIKAGRGYLKVHG